MVAVIRRALGSQIVTGVPLAHTPEGLHWADLLRYLGLAFQIAGVLFVAKGISDVRRHWTALPGIWGRVQAITRLLWEHSVVLFWRLWDAVAGRLGRLPHPRAIKQDGEAGAASNATGIHRVLRPAPPIEGTVEERLAWLEENLLLTLGDVEAVGDRLAGESRERQARDEEERAAWRALLRWPKPGRGGPIPSDAYQITRASSEKASARRAVGGTSVPRS
jgi:hypothetical protein